MQFFEDLLKLDSEWRTSEYVTVQRWIRKLRRKGSVSTLRAYFKLLAWFVRFTGVSPDEFVKLPKEELLKRFRVFVTSLVMKVKRVLL